MRRSNSKLLILTLNSISSNISHTKEYVLICKQKSRYYEEEGFLTTIEFNLAHHLPAFNPSLDSLFMHMNYRLIAVLLQHVTRQDCYYR
jgi:hypothetical protein